MKRVVEEQYNQFYREIGFERAEIFSYIKEEFESKMVLYPGSSIHITPSFYFEHVVYIDRSDLAAAFFKERAQVEELIGGNRSYKRSPHFQYLKMDFTGELGLRLESYDLLISLFSGKQIEYCHRYLKKGGLILTNSLFSDNETLKDSSLFTLERAFKVQKGKVVELEESEAGPGRSRLVRENRGFSYRDDELYYIYRKMG